MRRVGAIVALLAALGGTGCGGGEHKHEHEHETAARTVAVTSTAPVRPAPRPGPPAAGTPIPRSPRRLAARLAPVVAELRRDLDAWLATHPGPRGRPPARVTLEALYQQRSYRFLARHPGLIAPALRAMPRWLRPEARDTVGGLHALFTLTSLATEVRFRTGPPTPPLLLRRYYREAQRRFGVPWNVLAGVNFIESNFGRLRNISNAGAVGPMQFLPATWGAYGLGGDIRDPHDAILGAANYLRASGAPHSDAGALFHYNPAQLYVRAVLRYAHRMGRDRRAFYAYWSWQSFMRTRSGDRQLSGPGADGPP